jgi:predicted transcriptional regulator
MNRIEHDEYIEQLRKRMEYLGISQTAAASALGVTPKTIGNYLSGVTTDDHNLRRLEIFLKRQSVYKGYEYQQQEAFAELFDRLWDKCIRIKKGSELCSILGLTQSEVTHIRERSRQVDVRKQYEILSGFFNLCFAYTGVYLPGFEETGEELFELLGVSISQELIEQFAKSLNGLLAELPFEVSNEQLAAKAGVKLADLEDMRRDDQFPFSIGEKRDILYVLYGLCEKYHVDWSSEVFTRLYNWVISFDCSITARGLQEDFDSCNDTIASFKKLPEKIQEIVLEHQELFFQNPHYDEEVRRYMRRYDIAGLPGIPADDQPFTAFDYYYAVISLFRERSSSEQEQVFAFLKSTFAMPVPCCQSEREEFYMRQISQCSDLALLSKRTRLSDEFVHASQVQHIGKNQSLNVRMRNSNLWDFYSSEEVRCKIELTSMEWCLMAVLIAAVYENQNPKPLLGRIMNTFL